jgi:hypothetical protein
MSTLTSQGSFYTTDPGTPIRIAQVIGLTTSGFLAGKTFAASSGSVPAFLKAPAPLLAQQIKTLLDADKIINPVAALLSTSIFGFFAYRSTLAHEPQPLASLAFSELSLIESQTQILARTNISYTS